MTRCIGQSPLIDLDYFSAASLGHYAPSSPATPGIARLSVRASSRRENGLGDTVHHRALTFNIGDVATAARGIRRRRAYLIDRYRGRLATVSRDAGNRPEFTLCDISRRRALETAILLAPGVKPLGNKYEARLTARESKPRVIGEANS